MGKLPTDNPPAQRWDRFSNLHEIEEVKGFFRRGQIGSWRDQFTVAQSEWFDRIYAERMGNTGLDFDFE